jgi:hypothetical protein
MMSRGSVLSRGQLAAQAGMCDTCTVRRRTGSATDRDTGASTPTYSTLYAGMCKVQGTQAEAGRTDAGEDYLLLLRMEVHLPVAVTGLQVGDEITITAAPHDADLTGRVFRVHDLAHKSWATARRVGVIEKTGS